MARSRSLFDDLSSAIATAASLTHSDDKPAPISTAPLVSFLQAPGEGEPFDIPDAQSSSKIMPAAQEQPFIPRPARIPTERTPVAGAGPTPVVPPPVQAPITVQQPQVNAMSPTELPPPPAQSDEPSAERRPQPPKLPDLSGVTSPIARCEKIVAWIGEATGASDVFLADASGYPLAGSAGSAMEVDAKLAGTGMVTASIASLAAAIPDNSASSFELHIGEGPVFQLIGFQAGASVYVVGFMRSVPLTPRQSHAIRLACRHALDEALKGGLWESD